MHRGASACRLHPQHSRGGGACPWLTHAPGHALQVGRLRASGILRTPFEGIRPEGERSACPSCESRVQCPHSDDERGCLGAAGSMPSWTVELVAILALESRHPLMLTSSGRLAARPGESAQRTGQLCQVACGRLDGRQRKRHHRTGGTWRRSWLFGGALAVGASQAGL